MAFDKGKIGEYSVYKKIKYLETYGYRILINLYVPKEDNTTSEIDLVLITTKGIFVIECKNYSGWIFGNENQRMWTQTLPSGRYCHKEHFYNPVMQNYTHIKYLKKIIVDDVLIKSIVVFSDNCEFKNVKANNSNVIQEYQLVSLMESQISSLPNILKKEKVDYYYDNLYPYTQVDYILKLKHIQNIQNKKIDFT